MKVMNHGFSPLNLTTIVAKTQSIIMASCGLLKRVGMKFEETLERFVVNSLNLVFQFLKITLIILEIPEH